jgi:Zn-dependent protease with chaperone function
MGIEGRAVYRDEPAAPARPVTVMLDLRGLTIRGLDGAPVAAWPFANLVRLKTRGKVGLALGAGGRTGRVEFTDTATAAAFNAALRAIPEAGSIVIRRSYAGLAIGAGIAAAALVSAGWWMLSVAGTALSPMVPDAILRSLDTAGLPSVHDLLGTDVSTRCTTPDGSAALDRLVNRVVDAGGARDMPLNVAIHRSDRVGSASLPGGTVILTSALVAAAADGDVIAGVIGHEIGHLQERHGLVALMQRGGVPTTVALLLGRPAGIDVSLVSSVVSGGWSEDDEIDADAFAIDAIAAGGGRPGAYTDFLAAMALDATVNSAFTTIHPPTPDRLEAAKRRAGNRSARPGPLVTPGDVAAIRGLCDGASP